MGTLKDSLGSAGPGTQVTINGTTWTLSRTTKGMHADFSEWLFQAAKRETLAMAEDYRRRARQLWREAKALQEESEDDSLSDERQAEIAIAYEDTTGEARSLELESRHIVDRLIDRRLEYEFHGEAGIASLRTLPGQFKLCHLMLLPHHPELTLDDVKKLHHLCVDQWSAAMLEAEGLKNGKSSPASSPATTTNPSTSP